MIDYIKDLNLCNGNIALNYLEPSWMLDVPISKYEILYKIAH